MKIPALLQTLLAVTHTALAADAATLRIGCQQIGRASCRERV